MSDRSKSVDPPWSVTAAPEVALILAAGLGSRLRAQTKTPKPLIRVLGLTLAERVVCTLLAAGVQRFLIILGHEAETITAHFADIAQRRGVTIEFVEAKDWELGNGASAHAAATGRLIRKVTEIQMLGSLVQSAGRRPISR